MLEVDAGSDRDAEAETYLAAGSAAVIFFSFLQCNKLQNMFPFLTRYVYRHRVLQRRHLRVGMMPIRWRSMQRLTKMLTKIKFCRPDRQR